MNYQLVSQLRRHFLEYVFGFNFYRYDVVTGVRRVDSQSFVGRADIRHRLAGVDVDGVDYQLRRIYRHKAQRLLGAVVGYFFFELRYIRAAAYDIRYRYFHRSYFKSKDLWRGIRRTAWWHSGIPGNVLRIFESYGYGV